MAVRHRYLNVPAHDVITLYFILRSDYFPNLLQEQKQWTLLETKNPPLPRNSFSFSVVGEELYVFGGQIETMRDETDDFYKLDLHTLEWTAIRKYKLEDTGEATAGDHERNGHDAHLHQGRNDEEGHRGANGDMREEKTEADGDKEEQNPVVFPPPRADHSVVVVNKKLVLYGGFLGRRDYFRYKDIYTYDTGLSFSSSV